MCVQHFPVFIDNMPKLAMVCALDWRLSLFCRVKEFNKLTIHKRRHPLSAASKEQIKYFTFLLVFSIRSILHL
jgi:hypothetical protein